MKKKVLLFIFIFVFSLSYRWQKTHSPFWVDEFSSANQALLITKYGAGVFLQDDHYVEPRNFISHILIAISFMLFGTSEWAARFPSVVLGSLVPVAVYVLSKEIYEKKSTALGATFFASCSYFLITWSQQARSYTLQQLLLLLALTAYINWLKQKNRNNSKVLLSLIFICILGFLTHTTFILIIASFIFHLFITNKPLVFEQIQSRLVVTLVLCFFIVVLVVFLGTLLGRQTIDNLEFLYHNGIQHNLAYYHSFLWREYGIVTFLGVLGLLYASLKQLKLISIIWYVLASYLVFFSFLFGPVVSRYLLPIFPLLLIGMAISIDVLSDNIVKKSFLPNLPILVSISSVCICLIVILNGHKFTLLPKNFYSVNHDFREIALIDYDQVYEIIKEKGNLEEGKTAVIDTWSDRLEWYLGIDYKPSYMFRWENGGLMKQTPYSQKDGEKIINLRPQTRLISSIDDLHKAMQTYSRGFIWIDDSTLPKEVIEYVKSNFKQELYLDHYELDDNPYSIWPGTLYSWGFENRS